MAIERAVPCDGRGRLTREGGRLLARAFVWLMRQLRRRPARRGPKSGFAFYKLLWQNAYGIALFWHVGLVTYTLPQNGDSATFVRFVFPFIQLLRCEI
jgi:hypothetical protein